MVVRPRTVLQVLGIVVLVGLVLLLVYNAWRVLTWILIALLLLLSVAACASSIFVFMGLCLSETKTNRPAEC